MMNVYVVVQHYDRGSDEVNVEGVFQNIEAALDFIYTDFPGWSPTDEDIEGPDWDPDNLLDLLGLWHYQDPEDDNGSNRVMIQQMVLR